MTLLTTTGAAVLRPEDVAALLVQPVQNLSLAMTVATVVNTQSHDWRLPVVVADPVAGFTAEGAEIAVSDADLDEVVVTPAKVAALSVISRELANDSDPAAAQVVGEGIARDIARKVDAAFFGNLTSPNPAGLGGLAGVTSVEYPNGGFVDLDPLASAISEAEQLGAGINAWVTDPDTLLTLSTLKTDSGTSNQPLLGQDATRPTGRVALGVPVYGSPYVAAGTVWGIPRDRVFVVIREDSTIETSTDAFFSSDRVAVRGVMRVGFGFGHAAAIVKITEAEA